MIAPQLRIRFALVPRLTLIAALIAFASPIMAASVPFCPQPHPGLYIRLRFGPDLTEREENAIYLRLLKQRGVEVSMVRQWGGCVQAFVLDEDGRGEHLEYYDPDTLERITLTRTGPSLLGR
ncbi:MAG: hypothetical protein ABL866_10055 [Devosia sp.]